jgi:hypothetical protein
MPLFTVTMRASRSADETESLSSAIHAASVAAGYPANDLFQRGPLCSSRYIDVTKPHLHDPVSNQLVSGLMGTQMMRPHVRLSHHPRGSRGIPMYDYPLRGFRRITRHQLHANGACDETQLSGDDDGAADRGQSHAVRLRTELRARHFSIRPRHSRARA